MRQREIGEVRLHLGLDLFAVGLARVEDVQRQPQRQPVRADPHVAPACCAVVHSGNVERDPDGQLAFARQFPFQLIADVPRQAGAVERERILRGDDGVGRIRQADRRSHLDHVLDAGQVGHQITAGREGPGEVGDLLPLIPTRATIRLLAVHADFDGILAVQRIAAAVPQRHQELPRAGVGLPFDVDVVRAAAAAHVSEHGRGIGRLDDFRAEVVDAGLRGARPGVLHGLRGIGGVGGVGCGESAGDQDEQGADNNKGTGG